MLLKLQPLISVVLVGALGFSSAASPVIGVAKARGSFRIDNATVSTNGTLFDGSAIETANVSPELHLASGARLLLAPGSQSKVYRDRMVLEKGAAQSRAAENYPIEVRTLRVLTVGEDSTAQVTLDQAGRVQVAALNGSVQVTNAQGVLVANILSGSALELQPQADSPLARVVGRLQQTNGRFILTDETTNVTVELQGVGLGNEVGNVIEVTGTTISGAIPVTGATQVIRVGEHQQAGTPPVAMGVLSTGATIAIIGGVIAAATVVGLWLGGVFEEKPPISP